MKSWKQKVEKRLRFVYGENLPDDFVSNLSRLVLSNKGQCKFNPELWNERDIALITYGDSLLNNDDKPLEVLDVFAKQYLKETFSTIHILPFFPFSSDDGFSVINFNKVNETLGDWSHIEALSSRYNIMADLVINHASSKSEWFNNFLRGEGEGADFFIEGDPNIDLSIVTRPRSTPLLTPYETKNGIKHVWTTFSADQIDLNFENPTVLFTFIEILISYLNKGIRIIRLDAIAFLWKQIGTTCLHHSKTHEIVKLLRDIVEVSHPGTILITETNVPNKENLSYFGDNDEAHMVYQFSLPPLLLHALYSGNGSYLTNWAKSIPELEEKCTFFNFTSSHDGIGVRPLEGLLPNSEKEELYEGIKKSGGLISMKKNSDGTESPYELNITYFDSLMHTKQGKDSLQLERFLCSQTIALAMKGLPAVYIHSLLASNNNIKGVEKTGRARTINREQLNYSNVVEQLSSDTTRFKAFNELTRIIEIRKQVKAFHPSAKQDILNVNDSIFAIFRYDSHGNNILALSNLTNKDIEISDLPPGKEHSNFDLLSQSQISNKIRLKPYQSMWLTNK